MRKLTSILLFSFISLGGAQSKEKNKLQEEINNKQAEIAKLREQIKVDSAQARKLYQQAKDKAENLKAEVKQKLVFYKKVLRVAKKSREITKAQLNESQKLANQAKTKYKLHAYGLARTSINKAIFAISKVPIASMIVTPALFAPNENDSSKSLSFACDVASRNPIKGYELKIYKTDNNEKIEIHSLKGTGEPPKNLSWNGRLNGKLALDSASQYLAELLLTDNQKNVGRSGKIKFKTDIFITKSERGDVINVSSIRFKRKSDKLLDEYKITVETVHRFLLEYPDYQVIVEGHTDYGGRAGWNKKLSQKRARSVKNYLVELGMNEARLKEYGLGEIMPVSLDIEKRAINRRVSFILIKDQGQLETYLGVYKGLNFRKEVKMKKK